MRISVCVASNWNNISNFSQGLAYFGIGAAGGWMNLYTFGMGGSAFMAIGNGLMQGNSTDQIITNAFTSAMIGGISFGISAGMGAAARDYNKIANLGARYGTKIGYSAFSGAITGGVANSLSQIAASNDDGYKFNTNSLFRSMILGASISGGIAAGFAAYDYATWDRYDMTKRAQIISKKTGIDIDYADEATYNKHKEEFKLKHDGNYSTLDGYTTPDAKSYIGDYGLRSFESAYSTAFHEFYHMMEYSYGISGYYSTMGDNGLKINKYIINESKAYNFEKQYIRSSAPSRYYPYDAYQLKLTFKSNSFFNIWR